MHGRNGWVTMSTKLCELLTSQIVYAVFTYKVNFNLYHRETT